MIHIKCRALHTCHNLWTKISDWRQNFKGDLTKLCEIFLNITLELPQYSLFFVCVRNLWKPQQCLINIYFFIKSVVKWSENSVRYEFLWKLPPRWAKFCEISSQCEIWHVWDHLSLFSQKNNNKKIKISSAAAICIIRILTLVLPNRDMSCLCKQCRSRSVGFWRSQLIWICTVCH